MSISYTLELAAPVSAQDVMTAVVEAGGGVIEESEGTGGSLHSGAYFVVDVAEYDPPDAVAEQFGFAPTLDVYFGLRKFVDYEAQETDVIRLSLGVLARIPGDALLHSQHDEVWLLRRAGRLTVNDSLWRPRQLELLSPPYERGFLGFD